MDKKQAAAGGLAALAVAAIIGGAVMIDGPAPTTPDAAIDAPAGALTTDLLTAPVLPGADVATSVNLPDGFALVGGVDLTGAARDCFTIKGVEQDGEAVHVTAANTCFRELRFTANIHYQPAK